MTTVHTFSLDPSVRPMLRDLGVQPEKVFRGAGLPADLLNGAETRLPTADYFRFWESLENEISDPAFPIKMVEAMTAETFMPPLFAALCSQNFKMAAERISVYKRLVAPMAFIHEARGDAFSVRFEWLEALSAPPASLLAVDLVFITHLIRLGTREKICPLEVVASHALEPADAYAEYFGVSVIHGNEASLTFSQADAERPFLTSNETLWNLFEPELRRRLVDLDAAAPVPERVRAVLLEGLPSGQTSMEAVAQRLSMSKRTLQRRLKEEQTTFQDLLSRIREDLARHYLKKTALPCNEISYLLGFEDPNSFFRAFQGWTGQTPESVRHAMAT